MNDSEILDQVQNLRIQLSEMVDPIPADETAQLMIAVSIYVAGIDALLEMRKRD